MAEIRRSVPSGSIFNAIPATQSRHRPHLSQFILILAERPAAPARSPARPCHSPHSFAPACRNAPVTLTRRQPIPDVAETTTTESPPPHGRSLPISFLFLPETRRTYRPPRRHHVNTEPWPAPGGLFLNTPQVSAAVDTHRFDREVLRCSLRRSPRRHRPPPALNFMRPPDFVLTISWPPPRSHWHPPAIPETWRCRNNSLPLLIHACSCGRTITPGLG